MTAMPHELQHHWTAISPLLSIRNEHEYDLAVERLNRLLDEVGTAGYATREKSSMGWYFGCKLHLMIRDPHHVP